MSHNLDIVIPLFVMAALSILSIERRRLKVRKLRKELERKRRSL